ncbi:hypothetical protein PFDG_04874 [Plasmodium falciparum Dd2]|uniref:Plasmodium falciparum erythrocyte membrane protein 1 acidic terminal segment domain-containing protein n=1 Tax=Plasmodium falciparum (isolate Dd2) TaxID=57267 RepID=A0A0L7M9S5_PLAF4|nr:hypothetical protein PFDG_04874 [Plasmodium falciparum Dd2]
MMNSYFIILTIMITLLLMNLRQDFLISSLPRPVQVYITEEEIQGSPVFPIPIPEHEIVDTYNLNDRYALLKSSNKRIIE